MFIPYRIDVNSYLKPPGQENELCIIFESPLKVGNELEKKFGARKAFIRDKRRCHIRKAQYHWGWDWGPVMLTAGPWLPVYIDSYDGRIVDVHVTSDLDPDHSKADLTIEIHATGAAARTVKLTICDQDGQQVYQTSVALGAAKSGSTKTTISNPRLWWTNGLGDAHLYRLSASLEDETETEIDAQTLRFGVRTIKVIQRPLDNAPGKTFMFNINGQDVFTQGGNWIPADMCITNISRERYFGWVELAKYNHLNMIRVWGGGIYEREDFYDACDENGIMVWQDFGFACGDYPVHKAFLDSIKLEAETQTLRLRNRACLALWAGCNEDFLIADWVKVKYDYSDTKGPFQDTAFPQREIYLKILPDIVERLCPSVQYWPSSPWGEGDRANDPTYGDIHQWGVWHLDQQAYQRYKDLSGRFVSEFGMHGYPVMRTVDVFAPEPKDRFPQSRVIDCHNKGHGAEVRIARYMSENFRYDMKLENFVYCSHLLQSEAYGYALRDWKRKFGGKGKEECAGAIIWQLNDVYPCTSWAYVDYYLRPKPSFYTIRRSYAPISVGIERTPRSRWIDEDKPLDSYIPRFAIFAHNTKATEAHCELQLKAYDLHTGKMAELDAAAAEVALSAGCNTELTEVKPHASWTEESLIILQATLVEPLSGKTLARFVDWPEPYRYLRFPGDTKVTVTVCPLGSTNGTNGNPEVEYEDIVTISSNHPVKGCWMEPVYDGTETDETPEPLWEDNMFDLLPLEEVKVKVKGLNGRQIKVRFLGDWEMSSL
ncbi:glycoside hydrolase superfamily [Xylariales sp. PMI_506]|nr:glycoside hydrolase superfamily [Xylariales sp. PMI_506]